MHAIDLRRLSSILETLAGLVLICDADYLNACVLKQDSLRLWLMRAEEGVICFHQVRVLVFVMIWPARRKIAKTIILGAK